MRKANTLTVIIVALLLACGINAPSPKARAQDLAQTYDGTWSGTTSQGLPLSFTVVGDIVTTVDVTLNIGGCTIPMTIVANAPVSGGSFTLDGANQSITGSFTSPNQATGTGFYSNLTQPCFGIEYVTWSATRAGAETYSIAGVVSEPLGAAVAGAQVTATPLAGGQDPVSALTAADGSYTLTLPAGAYSVQATKSGYQTGQSLIATLPPSHADANFTLTPIVANPTISGTVRDSAGSPLAGAQVMAAPLTGGQGPVSALTAADGSYTLTLPAGVYGVQVTKDGYLTGQASTVVVPPSRVGINFTLSLFVQAPPPLKTYLPLVRASLPPLPRLRVSGDASVIEGRPSTNFGSTSSLWTGYHDGFCTSSATDSRASRGLLRFDLGSLAAQRVVKATLYLRAVTVCYGERSSAPLSAYLVTGDWSPSGVTWENQPPTGNEIASRSITLSGNTLEWHTLDVTEQVRRWASGAEPNQGLMLRTSEDAGDGFIFLSFASSEWTAYAPYIELVLSE